ncbi:hypothetical protein RB595_004670 [Gaeumannomyces hyphopodioides]
MAASLQFFLTRPGTVHTSNSRVRHGTNVPLIPVDQLPEWLHIVEVPRVLSDQHAAGLTNVGLARHPPETLEVFVLQDGLPVEERQHDERTATAKTAEHAPPPPPPQQQQQQFGRRPGDFIRAQALGTVRRGHGGSGMETEREALPEQRSPASGLLRALDDDLAAERTGQPGARAVQQPLEDTLDDRQQPRGGSGAQGDRHSPSRCGSVASHQPVDSRLPVAARGGLASSIHAPRVAAEHKTPPPPPLSKLPFSRVLGAPPQLQQEQPRGPPPTAEAWDPAWTRHTQGRVAAPGHGRGASYCRHWCVHGTCKWGRHCRYHHAMPATPDGLAEVGLREFPEWWTAAMGLATRGLGMEQQQQTHDGNQARHRQPAGEVKAPPRAGGGLSPGQEAAAVVRRGAAAAPSAGQARGHIRDDDHEALRAALIAHGYPASLLATRRPAAS